MKAKMKQMLDTIRNEARYTAAYTGRSAFDKKVMRAMASVNREHFVTEAFKSMAYEDSALPIAHGQTISQPYIVALMTDLLELTPESVVLEIGTGSGYQAAVLSKLAKQVYSVEKIPELASAADQRLKRLGFHNIKVSCNNGYYGWKEYSPFDAITVTAAATHIPQALIDQLKPGGRLAIPVGMPYLHQELMLVRKNEDNTTQVDSILGVIFVPLVDDPEVKDEELDYFV